MSKKLSIKDYHFLQDYITKNISDKKRIESVHGFMAGIICAPSMISPSDWMGYVFNDDNGKEINFNSKKEVGEIIEIIMSMYNDTADSIIDMKFKPLLSIDKTDITPDDAKIWCEGFMDGLSMWDENFEEYIEEEDFREIITPMLLLHDPDVFFKCSDDDGKTKILDDSAKNELKSLSLDQLADSVVDLRYYFMDEDDDKEGYVPKEKVGRNEPCPCGSGKKYKKCCGN